MYFTAISTAEPKYQNINCEFHEQSLILKE